MPPAMKSPAVPAPGAEEQRLAEDLARAKNWKRWGPYLAERQWSTVREDYSATGECWDYFPHDHARSRAYRWGEDGLLGITDRECRLCFGLALWNGRDSILKERLFGLTNPEGNHGEDVKELYYYLDSTPTHSWMRGLYKYPQAAFPYDQLVAENRRRGLGAPEYEISDTGVFDDGRYFDVFAEYAKAGPDHLLIQLTVANRGPQDATLHLLPTLWCRNLWTWGCTREHVSVKPQLKFAGDDAISVSHESLGEFELRYAPSSGGTGAAAIFTENETNYERLWGVPNASPYVKDAFHRYVINGETAAVNPDRSGTKAALHYVLQVAAGGEQTVTLQLFAPAQSQPVPFGQAFAGKLQQARRQADEFYDSIIPAGATPDEREVIRQGCAGLLWSKQFYYYVVDHWLDGDPNSPPPPESRKDGRNRDWRHLHARDVISMPDKWEYPWFAAWDLAFHMLPMARLDPDFAKQQILLFLREWYLHPNGQIPAYEFAFSDVNPPVHAWAAWRVYKISGARGRRDRDFLESVFQKLLLNFTWWVNRKDAGGKNLFSGGFLGLDNIGVFDRGQPIPGGGQLRQADGTAWMAFYANTMLAMALELAHDENGKVHVAYEDMASKFFEHFVQIVDAMNNAGGTGLWDEQDGFYYDQIDFGSHTMPLKTRSVVGLLPLIAVEVLDRDKIDSLPGFKKRYDWFLQHRPDLARHISYCTEDCTLGHRLTLLAVPSRERLTRVLRYLLDEAEFLSPHGVRSVSKYHERTPFVFRADGRELRLEYTPAESNSLLFGGNSNWRGPIWFPINYLIVEALERYYEYYRNSLLIETPVGSGRMLNLRDAAREIAHRLGGIFLADDQGRRPVHGQCPLYVNDPHFRELVLFYEYFHGDNGRGVGASHQTGWTALVVRFLGDQAHRRDRGSSL
jgi:Glycosyl hydrolase family 63 C-terminal domain